MGKNDLNEKWYHKLEPVGLIFIIILFIAIVSYFMPAGEFDRIVDENTGRTLVDPDSYHEVEQNPTSLMELFSSVSLGMQDAAEIICFVLILGGSFKIITDTCAIETGIKRLAIRMKGKGDLLVLTLLFAFGLGGATNGK
mgnify:CR=1 FL=1